MICNEAHGILINWTIFLYMHVISLFRKQELTLDSANEQFQAIGITQTCILCTYTIQCAAEVYKCSDSYFQAHKVNLPMKYIFN